MLVPHTCVFMLEEVVDRMPARMLMCSLYIFAGIIVSSTLANVRYFYG